MHLEFWVRTIARALRNEDPHIKWLFIPAGSYDYTIYICNAETKKEYGIQFLKTTKPDKEYEEIDDSFKRMTEEKEVPKELYT